MKSKWVEFQQQRIFYIDLSNFKEDERSFTAELDEIVSTLGQEMYTQPLHSVLVLVDIRNTVITQRVQALLSERIEDTRKYVKKTAVIGMHGIRGIFLDYFARLAGSHTVGFEDPEAGKKWLIK
jgi:hypothetical protein